MIYYNNKIGILNHYSIFDYEIVDYVIFVNSIYDPSGFYGLS